METTTATHQLVINYLDNKKLKAIGTYSTEIPEQCYMVNKKISIINGTYLIEVQE